MLAPRGSHPLGQPGPSKEIKPTRFWPRLPGLWRGGLLTAYAPAMSNGRRQTTYSSRLHRSLHIIAKARDNRIEGLIASRNFNFLRKLYARRSLASISFRD